MAMRKSVPVSGGHGIVGGRHRDGFKGWTEENVAGPLDVQQGVVEL